MIEALETKNDYRQRIRENLENCLTSTDLGKDDFYRGKVRDRYDPERLSSSFIAAIDRLSP